MNDLMLSNVATALVSNKPEYNAMMQNIDNKLPAVLKGASNFYKAHSQFMQVTLDVTPLTPLRSIYQSLAEIEQTKNALQENAIKQKKQDVELRRKQAQLLDTEDPFDKELLEIEILEIKTQAQNARNYMEGAVRKLNFFVNQYENILKKLGKTEITEEDYEREEAKYHIMTCMKQALNAARSRNGVIDEGNMIYLFDLGINAAQAQAEVFAYLNLENQLISEGKAPTHEMTVKWLEACAEKWQDDPRKFAESRGFSVLDKTSLTNVPQVENKQGE